MSTLAVLPTTPEAKVLEFIKERLSAGDQVLISATEPFMSPNEVAQLVGVSRPFIVKQIEHGRLVAVKRGNRYRITVAEAKRFVDDYRGDLATALGADF
ncbi:MAG: helix-turn-helix domain-containing protein [Promicromonosporaceae bacterium]|nr:helix-turn-helix domain-containing protein [Promicromonosporaceae bacterium]